MQPIRLSQPRRMVFGAGSLSQAVDYLNELRAEGIERIHIIASPSQADTAKKVAGQTSRGSTTVDASIQGEPTLADFHSACSLAREEQAQCIVGLGGGSPLDVAKLVAALAYSDQSLDDVFGIGLLTGRRCHLVCIPTTSGTGSEVSPNAILLDETARLKKGVISPFLVPDAAFIDPSLTVSLPAFPTAYTGLDALTHCIEAYTNRFAHPLVDLYAREGITLANRYLLRAVKQGDDVAARDAMARVSLLGGLCLGPVNTAAVHALAYPLGSEFHLAHGLSNALLLAHVFRFNAAATPSRHAEVAQMLGVSKGGSDLNIAMAGADRLVELVEECGIETDLAGYGIAPGHIPQMAKSAMTITRLLRNNPREVNEADCISLYEACFL